MQFALTTPVFKSIALAGLALGLGVAASSLSPERVTYRLSLHAVDVPGEVYLSVFRDGDIRVRFLGDKIHPITFKVRGSVSDGCRWLGIETLTPRDDRSFDYSYDERILSCDPDATPWYRTPRQGIVTVED